MAMQRNQSQRSSSSSSTPRSSTSLNKKKQDEANRIRGGSSNSVTTRSTMTTTTSSLGAPMPGGSSHHHYRHKAGRRRWNVLHGIILVIVLDLCLVFYQTFRLDYTQDAASNGSSSSSQFLSRQHQTNTDTTKQPIKENFMETTTNAQGHERDLFASNTATRKNKPAPQSVNNDDSNRQNVETTDNTDTLSKVAQQQQQQQFATDDDHINGISKTAANVRHHETIPTFSTTLASSSNVSQVIQAVNTSLDKKKKAKVVVHKRNTEMHNGNYNDDDYNDDDTETSSRESSQFRTVKATHNRPGFKLYIADKLHAQTVDTNDKTQHEEIPLSLVKNLTIPWDPLRSTNFSYPRRAVNYNISLPYLGVLIDGGRHYFPIAWLKRVVDYISSMKYNLIHLRLTDDQAFNVLFHSHPELAYPTIVDNPERRVWTVSELKDLVQYAKARNVEIMPEINVPGHGGAWAGIPGLVTSCPLFTCREGYGLPLNVSHPDLRNILTDILNETLQIFDPPFLHLGGDEVSMARPCFQERNATMYDYPAFEVMLQEIIDSLDIAPENVVRWEMTGLWQTRTPSFCGVTNVSCVASDPNVRAGAIEHLWESYPFMRHNATPRFFLSNRLYLDTMKDEFDYEVYAYANKAFHLKSGVVPYALIAGTFELSPQFWHDRNVLGRLLAISMGAANWTLPANVSTKDQQAYISDKYSEYCEMVGLGSQICAAQGRPNMPTLTWKTQWRKAWVAWKSAICGRLTDIVATTRIFKPMHAFQRFAISRHDFWRTFGYFIPPANHAPATKHVGVIVDTTSSLVPLRHILATLPAFSKLNFNTMMLRLAGNNGFTADLKEQPRFGFSMLQDPQRIDLYTESDLQKLVRVSSMQGIDIIPEISFKTNAAGWYGAGFLAACPNTMCKGGLVANDIRKSEFLPVVFSIVGVLRYVFPSPYLHFGHDDRIGSQPCFEEARINGTRYHDRFERKLKALLDYAEIPESNILRYENRDVDQYEVRAGGIKHYQAGTRISDIKATEPFFVTVDVLDGTLYDVYMRTRQLMELEPLGILAELRHMTSDQWEQYQIFERLSAFAIGTGRLSNLQNATILTEREFDFEYKALCQAKMPRGVECKELPEKLDSVLHITETEEWRDAQCSLRTQMRDSIGAKNVSPYYSREVMKAVFGGNAGIAMQSK